MFTYAHTQPAVFFSILNLFLFLVFKNKVCNKSNANRKKKLLNQHSSV